MLGGVWVARFDEKALFVVHQSTASLPYPEQLVNTKFRPDAKRAGLFSFLEDSSMTQYSTPCNDVVRVRVPEALHNQLRATGVPVSQTIRLAIVSYLAESAHPDLTRLVEKDF